MTVLNRIESIEKQVAKLMDLNQATYIRDDKGVPVGTSWTLGTQKMMFNILNDLIFDVKITKEKIKPLF